MIPQIEDWHKKNGSSISIKIFITEQKISFTGICANKEFLKFRLIGSSRPVKFLVEPLRVMMRFQIE